MQMRNFIQDMRFGARLLLRNPGFAVMAVFALGLGIGGSTAIFSAVNSVLIRPLPYPEADRLVGRFTVAVLPCRRAAVSVDRSAKRGWR